MVERHDLDDGEGAGSVCWIKADLRIPSEAVAGAEKVCALCLVCKQRSLAGARSCTPTVAHRSDSRRFHIPNLAQT